MPLTLKKQTIKEAPLIKTPEVKQGLSLKITSTKTQEKIDQMLKELAKIKPEQGKPSNRINVIQKGKGIKFETSSSDSETSFDDEINRLEEAFGKFQRITSKRTNWCRSIISGTL